MPRLLVTGGAGFIGANFVHYWLGRYPDDRLVVLDSLTYAGNLSNLDSVKAHPSFRFVKGDICDTQLVFRTLQSEKIDTIVHFAAESHVDRSIAQPDGFLETNVIGTLHLLTAARNAWIGKRGASLPHRFHHISTDEVYGSLSLTDPPFSESHQYRPNSPYSASKAASDHIVRAYHKTYGLQVTTTNCSNNYGPYQFPEKLIPLLIVNVLLGKPLPVYGDGLNVRDWLHVSDHCLAIDKVLRKGAIGEYYNVGGENERKNIDIVHAICRLIDEQFSQSPDLHRRFPDSPARDGASETLVAFIQDRPGHDRRYAVGNTKISTELGFVPHKTFQEGLRDTVNWYLENEKWWRSVQDGSYRTTSIQGSE